MQSRVNSESLVQNTDGFSTNSGVNLLYFMSLPRCILVFVVPSCSFTYKADRIRADRTEKRQRYIHEKYDVLFHLTSFSLQLFSCLIKLNSGHILSGIENNDTHSTLTRVLIVYGNSFQSILSAFSWLWYIQFYARKEKYNAFKIGCSISLNIKTSETFYNYCLLTDNISLQSY